MSTHTNQRLVLDLLENGKIDTSEAEWLLDTIHDQPPRRAATPYAPDQDGKIILEIDADQENLQDVVGKLSQAVGADQVDGRKKPFFQRLARRSPKSV
jgi:hypothetical protein